MLPVQQRAAVNDYTLLRVGGWSPSAFCWQLLAAALDFISDPFARIWATLWMPQVWRQLQRQAIRIRLIRSQVAKSTRPDKAIAGLLADQHARVAALLPIQG